MYYAPRHPFFLPGQKCPLNAKPAPALCKASTSEPPQSGQVVSPPSRTRAKRPSKLGQKGTINSPNSSPIPIESVGLGQGWRFDGNLHNLIALEAVEVPLGQRRQEMPKGRRARCAHFTATRDAARQTPFIDEDALIHQNFNVR